MIRFLCVFLLAALLGGCATGGAFTPSSTPKHIVLTASGATMPIAAVTAETERMNVAGSRSTEVAYTGPEPAGTIIIETAAPRLLKVIGDGKALQFRVAVGRPEHQWYGEKAVESVHLRPAWTAPDVIARANPNAAGVVIPAGAPNNPMGLGALVLSGGEYAIHGTNRPESIGGAVSFGCFRMFNEDIAELIRRTPVGARVIVR